MFIAWFPRISYSGKWCGALVFLLRLWDELVSWKVQERLLWVRNRRRPQRAPGASARIASASPKVGSPEQKFAVVFDTGSGNVLTSWPEQLPARS